MSDEQHRHGYAPEPSGEFPEQAPSGESDVPSYAVGDTGTRAVPIVPLEPEADDQAGEQAGERAGAHAGEYGDEYGAEPLPDEDVYLADDEDPAEQPEPVVPLRGGHRAGPRRTRRRGVPGCVAVLVALAVVVALVAVGGTKGYHFLKDHLGSSAADYAGPGTGSVTFEVHQGDTAAQIGRNLKSAGVVESVDAFIGAASGNPDANRIQVGFYQLKKHMKAADALDILVNPKNQVHSSVLVREGVRAADVVSAVAKATKKPAGKVQQALAGVTLPATADGKPEGYLFPATYAFGPGASPAQMFTKMVQTWQKQTAALDLKDTVIDGHTYTVQQLLTVASLVQSEGKTPDDMAKIARVIYNRVEHPGEQGQAGLLQIDATVDYALHRPLTLGLTQAERDDTDSPYNTFQHAGLPPGPIGNPGADAIKAALHPADGDWYYYVTVNLATGETKFAHSYAEFQQYVAEHQHYCATQSASGCR